MANAYSKNVKATNEKLYEQKKGADTVANTQAKQATAQANASANNASRAAYTRHAQAVKEMGNVSETTKNKLSVNLGQNVSKINTQKAENIAAINAANTAQKAKNTQNYYKTKSAKEYETRQKAIEYDTAKSKENLKMFSSTVSRYDSVKACDKAIKKLKKSNDPQKSEKIAYIANQRAKLKAEKKAAKSGGRGGYYRRGYGWGGGRNGSGDALELNNTPNKKDKSNSGKTFMEQLGDAVNATAKQAVKMSKQAAKNPTKAKTEKETTSYKKSIARTRASGRRNYHL